MSQFFIQVRVLLKVQLQVCTTMYIISWKIVSSVFFLCLSFIEIRQREPVLFWIRVVFLISSFKFKVQEKWLKLTGDGTQVNMTSVMEFLGRESTVSRVLLKNQFFIMVFCYQNSFDLLWEKIVLVIEKKFWNSRLKAENLQTFWDH